MAKGMREIKRQIKSIRNTQQITKAMEMIAAARLKRAQNAALNAKPYARKIREVVESLAGHPDAKHPLIEKRPVKTIGYILLSGDRGLAGGYHANVFRMLQSTVREQREAGKKVELFVIGRKGYEFVRRLGWNVVQEKTGVGDFPTFGDIKTIASQAVQRYASGQLDELVLVYSEFVTVLSQRPTMKPLLPLDVASLQAKQSVSYECEPSVERVLSHVLPQYAETVLYAAVLQAKASEFASRMTAMSNANKNATQFIQNLTLQYNRARQASITQEITEIVAGANAQ